MRADLAIAGVPVKMLSAGWLGACGAADPADLASRQVAGVTPAGCYAAAVAHVRTACRLLLAEAWDDNAVATLLADMYWRCALAFARGTTEFPPAPQETEAAIDAACEQHDWAALKMAVEAFVRAYCSKEPRGVSRGMSLRL